MQTGTVGAGNRAQSPDPERHNRESSGAAGLTSASTSDEEKRRIAFDPAEMFTKDWRNYHCKTWHLEPTVR
jgi:Fragile site-associated protein C-terminus.